MIINHWFVSDVGCPSDVQWDALINYIAPDPEMLNGAMTNPNGKARLNRKWESLSYIVNAADPESAQKTGKGWKNVSTSPFNFVYLTTFTVDT